MRAWRSRAVRWIVTSRRAGNAAPVNVLKYLLFLYNEIT